LFQLSSFQHFSFSFSMTTLLDSLGAAENSGALLPSSAENIRKMLSRSPSPLTLAVIGELVEAGRWDELNNRFFRTLAFGTGGLRGKTIGAVLTDAEKGPGRPDGRPEHACIGTNAMNDYNIIRATQGLAIYSRQWHQSENRPGRASICISYDTRFFSREFADLAAKVMTDLGCDALLFEGPRSTPELSFAVRYRNATAGINITASHNPPAYNGYKVYFDDGGQVIEPHASAIIDLVNAGDGDSYTPLPEAERGQVIKLGREIDEAYMSRLEKLIIDPELFHRKPALKTVYTPLHGVGGVIIVPMLHRLGVECVPVPSQMVPDGLFPTVKSPNPENAEALTLGMALADLEKADLVQATDPDDDRMGIAARDASGKLVLLTGNQIGSLMVWYRLKCLFEKGILSESNRDKAVVIKSLVTTDLQKEIALKFGVRCVETLTGFKYIGAKQRDYEEKLPAEIQANYRNLSEEETREARLKDSLFFVFGGEESYGYNTGDFVRDKDGNAAVICFAEVAAYAASVGLSVVTLLDRIFSEYGFYLERGESLTFEGAEGAAKIKKLVDSYAGNPPGEIAGGKVLSVLNYATQDIYDSEGILIPKEAMIVFEISGGLKVAVRPSGTEPKIKYYLYAAEKPASGSFTEKELSSTKERVAAALENLWQWLKADAEKRAE
jgi:phosphoglucomutase